MTEPQPVDQRYGFHIPRLNVCFQTVQSDIIESSLYCQAYCFSHQATSSEPFHSVIAQVCILKATHENLAEMRNANNTASIQFPRNKPYIGARHLFIEPGIKAFTCYERLNPGSMIRTAFDISLNKIICVFPTDFAQRYCSHNRPCVHATVRNERYMKNPPVHFRVNKNDRLCLI